MPAGFPQPILGDGWGRGCAASGLRLTATLGLGFCGSSEKGSGNIPCCRPPSREPTSPAPSLPSHPVLHFSGQGPRAQSPPSKEVARLAKCHQVLVVTCGNACPCLVNSNSETPRNLVKAACYILFAETQGPLENSGLWGEEKKYHIAVSCLAPPQAWGGWCRWVGFLRGWGLLPTPASPSACARGPSHGAPGLCRPHAAPICRELVSLSFCFAATGRTMSRNPWHCY